MMPKEIKTYRSEEVEAAWSKRYAELTEKYFEYLAERNESENAEPSNMLLDNEFLSRVVGLEVAVNEIQGIPVSYFRVDYPYADVRKHYCIVPPKAEASLPLVSAVVFNTAAHIINANSLNFNDSFALIKKDTGTFGVIHFHLLMF